MNYRYTFTILIMLLALSPTIIYAQEANVGILRMANFQTPRQVTPNSVFSVSLDVEYAIHGPENATIRSAIYSGSFVENQSTPLWQSPRVDVVGGGDMIWNATLTAPTNEGVMQLIAVAYFLNGDAWQYYSDPPQGPGYEQISVKVARTANLEIDLGEAGLQITVSNSTQQTSNSGSVSIALPVDESYSISVPTSVELKNSTRLIFSGWSDGNNNTARSILLDGDVKVVGSYHHQYLLEVTSLVSAYSQSKWYDAASNVTLNVNSTIPFGSPLDLIGLKYVFQGWTGDLNSKSTQINITMNSPKSINANFSVDYTPLILPGILVAGIIGAVVLTMLRRKRVATTPPDETVEPVKQVQATDSLVCSNCGKPTEIEWKHCIHCGTALPGPRPVDQ